MKNYYYNSVAIFFYSKQKKGRPKSKNKMICEHYFLNSLNLIFKKLLDGSFFLNTQFFALVKA